MSVADVLDQAERLIGMAPSRAGLTLAEVAAVGLSVPGFVDGEGGTVTGRP